MKKVLIPTSLNPVAKELLKAHGDYAVAQKIAADIQARVAFHIEL